MIEDKADSGLFSDFSQTLLAEGVGVRFCARGRSMWPAIKDGDIVHTAPAELADVREGDIVLFRDVAGLKAHRVMIMDRRCGVFVTRGDSCHAMDHPARAEQLIGKVISKEDAVTGKVVPLSGIHAQVRYRGMQARRSVSRLARHMPWLRDLKTFSETSLRNAQLFVVFLQALSLRALDQREVSGKERHSQFSMSTNMSAQKRVLGIVALFLSLMLLFSGQTFGQVALDSNTNGSARLTSAAPTLTLSHTTAGTNRLLVVGVSINLVPSTSATVSSVTYNGAPLTLAVAHNDAGATRRAEIWYMTVPPLGTANVVVTFAGLAATNQGVVVGATTFTGVDQFSPIRSSASADGIASPTGVTVASAAGDMVIDTLAMGRNFTINTYGAAQTSRWNVTSGGTTALDVRGVGSTGTGAASVTMSETLTGATTWSQAVISLRFAVAANPIAIDTITNGGGNITGATPTVTFAHTTAGTNRLLVVGVSANITNNTAATVAGVTYNGVALTRAGFHNDTGNTRRVEMWYLVAPPTGTFNVVVTFGPLGATTIGVVAGATTFTGADQTVPVRSFVSADGVAASTFSQLDVTSGPGETVIDTLAIAGNVTPTVTAPQTLQWGRTSAAATANPDVYGLGSTRTGAASVPLSETFSAASAWSLGALSVRPLQADLSVAVRGASAFFNANLTYTITVTNNGTSPATGVLLYDTLATGLTFVSATPSQGTCSGTGPISCSLGTLVSGVNATVTVIGTPTARGGYANVASVTSGVADYNLGNNSSIGTAFSQVNACTTAQARTPAVAPLTGVINTYFPVTANAATGVTSITNLGAATGAATPIASGDLLLIMQMQDAAISSSNDSTYGDGVSGAGSTNLNNAGVYEYVTATNAVAVAGTGKTLTFTGTGPGGGLIYSYTNAAGTATQGQRTFQVVRVPQYSNATLGAGLTALPWNGTTGGVLALDLSGTLTLNGITVSVDGLGFRGGAGLQLTGGTGANTDYLLTAPTAYAGAGVAGADGSKGEGIAGTPRWVALTATPYFLDTGVEGYPNGSMAKGAPGNAGGGGTDGDPQNASPGGNDQNSGGGGGANGGNGGAGGDSWNSNLSNGGLGGDAFPASPGRIVLGGGGGAGTRNNSTDPASAGAAGGGIVIFRVGGLSGTATITTNGSAANNVTANDSGGGGGAGGSIVVLSATGGESGLTVSAQGGRGGDSWDTQAFSLDNRHGPGGGGGGGAVQLTGPAASVNVSGGANGVTLNPGVPYGATPGAIGLVQTNVAFSQQPGSQPGAECVPDLTITKTHAPSSFVRGQTGTYTLTVMNISTGTTASTAGTVTAVDTLPTGLTATAIVGTGWTCTLGSLTCTRTDVLAPGASYPAISVTVNVLQTAANSLTNTATVSGGSEVVTSNDTATDVTTIVSSSDLSITKTASASTVRQGNTLTFTLTVTNGGPSNSTNVTVTDPLPAGVTYVSATSTQGTCAFAGGTVTCNVGAMNNGAVATITVTVTAGVPSIVTNTATVSATEPDPASANNTASASVTITYPTEVSLETFTATQGPDGISLSWKTAGEARNVGFNVYREDSGQRVQLNPSLIAGSALMVRGGLPRHSAKTYGWIDHSPSAATNWYWLEDVDLNGTRTLHGPVTPQLSTNVSPLSSVASRNAVRASAARATTMVELNDQVALSQPSQFSSQMLQATPSRTDRSASATATQFQLAALPAVKIFVTHEGWYRVTQPQLIAAGLSPWADPRSLQLFVEGTEQAIRVTGAGHGPGGFGPQAAIEFYGTGIDTPFSGKRVYWLLAGGQGRRIGQWNGGGSDGPQAESFQQTVELKQKTTFFPALLREDSENFFGALVSSAPVDQVLATPNVSTVPSQDVRLQVVLQGVIQDSAHDVRVSLNGMGVADMKFDGQDQATLDVPVARDLIRPESNTVTLTAQDGQTDLSLVCSIRLVYPHSYTADFDALKFTAEAGAHVELSGFQQQPTRLLDITYPNAPVWLVPRVSGSGSGFYLDVKVPSFPAGQHTLLTLADGQIGSPDALVANVPSSWHGPQSGAEFVVISSARFVNQVAPLAQLHRSEGRSVAVVSVEDLYDEFNFGEKDPATIRQFLQTATASWARKPAYLLLVGDASFDPRNYLGLGDFDFVPTKSILTAELKTASDDWFSDFTNTGFAQIATGRIPVRTEDDATTVVAKIVGYESGAGQGSWTHQALLVADADDTADNFTQQSKSIQALLPPSMNTTEVFAGTMSSSVAQQTILDNINGGKLLVNYNGHGSVEIWSNRHLLDSTTAESLTNGPALPVFVMMNCLNGFFHDIYTLSLAEALLLSKNGGAVAVWASSGLTSAGPQFQMDKSFISAIASAPTPTLGDAVRTAKQGITDPDVRRTFLLFGDPLLKVKFPTVRTPSSGLPTHLKAPVVRNPSAR